MAATLFVSHAPADDAFAQALTQALIEAGVDARAEIFVPDQQTPRDEHDIVLRDCMIFVPVLSRVALSSPRARAEARQFHDAYHDELGRFLLPVLIEPLAVEEIWPFLQDYQRIEGPPDEAWSPDALMAGVLRWVTQVAPAQALTPSGSFGQRADAPRIVTGLQTRPLGEALIAAPPEGELRAIQPGRSALSITLIAALIAALIVLAVGGLFVAPQLLRGQAPPSAGIAKPSDTPSAMVTEAPGSAFTGTASVSPPATAAGATTSTTPTPGSTTATPTPLPAILAAFVGVDATAQGTWRGVYGSQGYLLAPNDKQHPYSSIPDYASVHVNEATTSIWDGSTNDPRALQKPGNSDRIAASWRSGGAFNVDLALSDGQTHRIALYFLDWDGSGAPNGRVERVDAEDATTGATFNSQTLGQASGDANTANRFTTGKYLIWNIRGHVRFTITNLNSNAALSGLFFD
jgi:hypothetical protein